MLKNITLSADSKLIELARKKARHEKTSLNQLFREFLEKYSARNNLKQKYQSIMTKLNHNADEQANRFQQAKAAIRKMRKGVTLGKGLNAKKLIEEGRR